MTRILPRLLAIAALTAAAAPSLAQAPSEGLPGVWRNMRDTVHIRASPCGDAICGTVIWAAEQPKADARKKTGRDLVGMQLFRDFAPTGDNSWKGKIYIPDMDSTASGKILLTDPQSITVSGCVMLGIVCKTQHWKRIG
jgi:uncharacterized protein (DUF2147 family)